MLRVPEEVRIVYVSGHSRCGKDTVIAAMQEQSDVTVHYFSLASTLKEITHLHYGLRDIATDFFENMKDVPHSLLGNKTPRSAYIKYYEQYILPILGESGLVDMCHNNFNRIPVTAGDIIAFSGPGRQEEFNSLESIFAKGDLISRYLVHLEKPGIKQTDYRVLLQSDDIPTIVVKNINPGEAAARILAFMNCNYDNSYAVGMR